MQSSSKKWVYLFAEGSTEMRRLLGGKGADLCEMTRFGLPVPPGFVISTEACNAYYASGEKFPDGMWDQVLAALRVVETQAGKHFGDAANPLLVSVRSGAAISMPGMMDTVLNLGLNDSTVRGLITSGGDERFAYDTYRRFIQGFGAIVLGIDSRAFEEVLSEYKEHVGVRFDTELTADHWREVIARYRALIQRQTGAPLPEAPLAQLEAAVGAVFASWNGRRAIEYRNFNGIPHDLGTAVNIVSMVYGNLGAGSGTGVAFTRDPATGARQLYGEYLPNAQGEDVVAGVRTPQHLDYLAGEMQAVYQQFVGVAGSLEQHYRDAQDIEFTVERGRLYILQTRSAKRTPRAAVTMAVNMAEEGLITREEALLRVEAEQVSQLFVPIFDDAAKEAARARGDYLARGLAASPGAAIGKVIFDAHRAADATGAGEKVILVRPETSPDDIAGILTAVGVLTARGGLTSHAAVVTRGLGKPCVVGCDALRVDVVARSFTVDGRVFVEGDIVSVDGTTGEVFAGALPSSMPPAEAGELGTLLTWANECKRLGVRANADTPTDAAVAVRMGAEGIGLCRTEHMFLLPERLALVRRVILAAADAEAAKTSGDEASPLLADYRAALRELGQMQTDDFVAILRVMAGRPVIVRLLDPPLHEFLPRYENLIEEATELRVRGNDPARLAEVERLKAAVEGMREQNPMLGLRGCRLGIVYSDIYDMQVWAMMTASSILIKEGVPVHPEIMIPLVGYLSELSLMKENTTRVVAQVEAESGVHVPYMFGTMIEIPRAALTADEIARDAEFFSFGTNDLTQMTLGFSRDDAEGKFLRIYLQKGILAQNPFQSIDQTGVGKLVDMAAKLGRQTRPGLEVGICGEHGGDPQSIGFFHRVGLDYVSCSPYRIPVARVAAAQAAIRERGATSGANT